MAARGRVMKISSTVNIFPARDLGELCRSVMSLEDTGWGGGGGGERGRERGGERGKRDRDRDTERQRETWRETEA